MFEKVEQRAAQYFKPLHSRVQVRTHPRTYLYIGCCRVVCRILVGTQHK